MLLKLDNQLNIFIDAASQDDVTIRHAALSYALTCINKDRELTAKMSAAVTTLADTRYNSYVEEIANTISRQLNQGKYINCINAK